MTLRPYQEQAIQAARAAVAQGHRRILLVSPTGTGKTRILSAIAKSCVARGGSVHWYAHRRELIDQARAECPEAEVISTQAAVRNPRPSPTLQIFDEAHHYVAKTSTAERNFGCENLPARTAAERVDRDEDSAGMDSPRAGAGRTGGARNHHPTIKSISLTKWLATLIKPPGDGKRLLCPFAGSGGEVIGAMRAGWEHIDGIEQDADFVEIARARIARWEEVPMHLEPDDVAPVKSDERQGALF